MEVVMLVDDESGPDNDEGEVAPDEGDLLGEAQTMPRMPIEQAREKLIDSEASRLHTKVGRPILMRRRSQIVVGRICTDEPFGIVMTCGSCVRLFVLTTPKVDATAGPCPYRLRRQSVRPWLGRLPGPMRPVMRSSEG
jgi:hypothetical protein